jgi:hypothetical protein
LPRSLCDLSNKELAMARTTEDIDREAEEAYWRENYMQEPYYEEGQPYEYYAVFYRIGYEGRGRRGDRSFENAEPELRAEYERTHGASGPAWEEGRHAVRAAWHRLDHMFPDSD